MTVVAALYIDPRGPYPRIAAGWQASPDEGADDDEPLCGWLTPRSDALELDCWDEARDARKYAGPWPVVAHPPCGPWGHLAHMTVQNRERRWHDADCGPRAVSQVRMFGGVLEQPDRSKLFERCGLPAPEEHADAWGGYTLEVCQVEWGHVARKRTWLYIVGVPRETVERLIAARPFPGRKPTHWVSGGRLHDRKGSGGVVPPGIKVCSAQQRRRTPPAFAEFLIAIAREARCS